MSIDAKPWLGGGAASVPDASETVKGIIEIADSTESAAGTDDLKAMTPLKVKQRIDSALVGGVDYKGTFDASTGLPSIANAEKGDLYIIDTAGTIYGQTWAVGDHLLINEDMGGSVTNSKIDKVDNTDAVSSVNTQTGAVVLSADDLAADHVALNYIAANANIDGHLSGIDDEFFLKAPLASPALTGTPTATTATAGDNSTRIATTAYVDSAVSGAGNQINDIETKTSSTFTAQSNYVYVGGYTSGTQTVTMPDASASTKGDIIGFTTLNSARSIELVSSDGTTNDLLNISNQSKGGTLGALALTVDRQISWFICDGTQWQEANASFFTQPISSDLVPTSGNSYDLGSPSGEWADLYLGDNGIIYWGDDQDVKLIHDPDDGLILDLGVTDSSHDPQFELLSESSASFGPRLLFHMQSTTPAANDRLGQLTFKGLDSGSGSTEYAYVFGRIEDPTAGAEAGRVDILPLPCSTQTKGLHVIGIPSELGGAKVDIDHNGTDYGLHLNGTIVAASAAELSLLDGGSSVGASVSIVDTDGFILNDGGVTKLIPASDLKTYAGGGISAVVEDTTPQLGGPLDVNGQAITSASNGDVTINPDGTGDISIGADMIPDADATHTIGDENNRFISAYTDVNGAIRFRAKNDSGGVINKGQAVYIKGVSGTVPTVSLARANSASTMPAFGLALASANDQAELQVITFGNLTDYNTNTYSLSANDPVYVSAATAGALTNSAPTGESNLIQNIGRVVRADASAGIIKVGGAGRSNATPNLDDGKIFLGDASNQAVSTSLVTALGSVDVSALNDDGTYRLSTAGLNDVSDVSFTAGAGIDNYVLTYDNGTSSWGAEAAPTASAASETVAGVIEIATNAEATAGTATDKALVPSNLSSVGTSQLNNNAGFISGISGESLNDLSDVSFTAGAGIDNYVLTYDNGTSSWGAEAAPTASAASETVAGVIEIATNAETATGTATDKALVPSNISSIDLSQANNTTSAFISGISGESLNDLSDVSFTAGAGIDNYVLTYDNGTSSWGAEPASGGGGTIPDVVIDGASGDVTAAFASSGTDGDNERVYLINNGSTARTVTLPAVSGNTGKKFQIKRLGTANVTIAVQTGEDLETTTNGTYVISDQYSSVTVVCNASGTLDGWYII